MSKNTDKSPASTRPPSADYPVDPVERLNQEARLRKAAAAGASASKSPISTLMLQSSSAAALQRVPEPQAASLHPAPAKEKATETAAAQNEPRIDNDAILTELRKISVWADQQRKITRWLFIFLVMFVPGAIGIGLMLEERLKTNIESNIPPRQSDWYDVDRDVRLGDFEKAVAIGEELILKTPQYPEAHQRLAGAYLAAGNLEKAKEHYAEAFRLFPSEQNEKLLSAMEKRIRADSP